MKAHNCVLLAIDPGACSGWALFDRGALVSSGVAMRSEQRADVMDVVEGLVEGDIGAPGCRFVVVREDWTVGGGRGEGKRGTRWNPKTLIGMGKAWGRWEEQLEMAGMARRRIIDVVPGTWRRVLRPLPTRNREIAKASAQVFARAKLGLEHDAYIEPDRAEAIAIGYWGIYAPEVAAVLPQERAPRATRSRRLELVPGGSDA